MPKNLRTLVGPLAVATWIGATSARATMPMLNDTPRQRSPVTCKDWAAGQDDDALEMWGIQESGSSSRDVAIDRLTRFCLGKKSPDIVGFGSSAGFDEAYCENHKKAAICHKR